jgi:hypothetical protein
MTRLVRGAVVAPVTSASLVLVGVGASRLPAWTSAAHAQSSDADSTTSVTKGDS